MLFVSYCVLSIAYFILYVTCDILHHSGYNLSKPAYHQTHFDAKPVFKRSRIIPQTRKKKYNNADTTIEYSLNTYPLAMESIEMRRIEFFGSAWSCGLWVVVAIKA